MEAKDEIIRAKDVTLHATLAGITSLIEEFALGVAVFGQPETPKTYLQALSALQTLISEAIECKPEFTTRIEAALASSEPAESEAA